MKTEFKFMESLEQLALLSGRGGGKSMFMESRFQKWYADGNRKPANIGVQIADLEGTLDGISSWSSERLEKFQSLVYFMITFGGGYPNAVLVNS